MESKGLEHLLGILYREFLGEGTRVLKGAALSAVSGVVNGLRRLLLLQYVVISACFLWSMSVFGSGLLFFQQLGEDHVRVSSALGFCLGTLALTSLILYITVRERTWMNALHIQEHLDALERGILQEREAERQVRQAGMTPEEVAQVVERVLDAKLSAMKLSEKNNPDTDPGRAAS